MIEVICTRSGLKFEAPSRRIKVHPGISYYTSHKNTDVRYPAIKVIERGKTEGWQTIEKFEEEIHKALNPEPDPIPDHDFEGAWAAEITGSCEKYRFTRKFLTHVHVNDKFKYFKFIKDGMYECCYKSAKGNETRYYYQLENGVSTRIDLEVVEQMFPLIEEVKKTPLFEGCTKVDKHLGVVGAVIQHDNQIWVIEHTQTKTFYEDDDGITHEFYPRGGYMFSWNKTETYLRPATLEQIELYEAEQEAKKLRSCARARLKEIDDSISVSNGAVSENSDYPKGKQIVLKQGVYQPNKLMVVDTELQRLWSLTYNGRDGDDWSYNNVAGAWVGCYVALTPELQNKLEDLCEILGV